MTLVVAPVSGLPEVQPGADLARLLLDATVRVRWPDGRIGITSGDVLVVTSKVVAKAEGRLAPQGDREALIDAAAPASCHLVSETFDPSWLFCGAASTDPSLPGGTACYGDSGGPIYLGEALIGVVSRGLALPGKPCGNGGVYVRADTVAGWIEQVTKRKLVRATCGKDDEDGADDDAGGCSAAGAAGVPVAIAALIGLGAWKRRRRGAT